jgi:hypothetical protein
MSRYYFNYRDAEGFIPDEEGGEFTSLEAAAAEARLSARMALEIVKGGGDRATAGSIEMSTGDAILLTVPLFQVLPLI